MSSQENCKVVIPAQAGIQDEFSPHWIPACAGMTRDYASATRDFAVLLHEFERDDGPGCVFGSDLGTSP